MNENELDKMLGKFLRHANCAMIVSRDDLRIHERITLTTHQRIITKLIICGHIERIGGGYRITNDGLEHYRAIIEKPMIRSPNTSKWIEEVRTGISSKRGPLGDVSYKSEVNTAVIPKGNARQYDDQNIDLEIENINYKKYQLSQLKSILGLSIQDFSKYMIEGRIQQCGDHIGIFDRRGENGWQHQCRQCRREKRKK